MGLKIYIFFLDYYLAFILIGSQLWSSSVCELHTGFKIDTSPSVTVQQGLCVHVPCSFTVPSDLQLSISTTGIWYHMYNGKGYPIAAKNNLINETNGRFFLTGNVYRGDCSYSIEDPLPTDEGRYFFRFEDEDPIKFSYYDLQPYLSITELTDKPTISSTRLVDGEEVTWTCTSPGRCWYKRPQITWEGTMAEIRQEMYNITYEDGSRTFHSNITFTPRKSLSNSPLFCKVTFKPDLSTVEEQMMIVEYAPIQFSSVAAAVGGALFLVLLIVMGAFLVKKMRKKRQSINMDPKNNVVPPEEAIQENLQSSQGDDLEYMNHGDVQYVSVEFSKVKPKEVVPENMETEYSQIRKTPHN